MTGRGGGTPEVKASLPLLHKASKNVLRSALATAVKVLCGGGGGGDDVSTEEFAALAASSGLGAEKYATLYTGVLLMLRTAVRNRVLAADARTDLGKLGCPEQFVADFANALRKSHAAVEGAAVASRIRAPHVADTKWRVDVTIATSSAKRVLVPSVLMQLTLSDGAVKTFEMSIDKFNALRYNVAKVLREMANLEGHPIMHIMSELEQDQKAKQKASR